MLGAKLFKEGTYYAQGWNFGPDDVDAKNVEWITRNICELWGNGASYEIDAHPQPHESNYLKLDCSKAKTELNWTPKWNIQKALKSIVEWNKAFIAGENIREISNNQIDQYFSVKMTESELAPFINSSRIHKN
jgi:CDP-glucose 4,6-dehydratase